MWNPEAAKSDKSAEWVAKQLASIPCRYNEVTGNFMTCPVRISFPNLYKPKKGDESGKEKYSLNLLFPAGADLSLLKKAAGDTARGKWPNAGQQGGPSLHSPFRDQGERSYDGYVPGAVFLSCYGERQPPVVDIRGVPIIESDGDKKAYPGAWALVAIRPFAFDAKMKKGVSFGLQSVMVIADDVRLGGGAADTAAEFSGVNLGELQSTLQPADLF